MSHHPSILRPSVLCTLLAAKFYFVPGVELWFSAIVVSLLDSPAEECGLKPGDRILFLNGLDMRCVFFFVCFFIWMDNILLANISTGGCNSILLLPIRVFSSIFWDCFSLSLLSLWKLCVPEHLKLLSFLFYSFSFGTFWAATHAAIFSYFIWFVLKWLCSLLLPVVFHISVLAGRWCFRDFIYLTFCKKVKMESSFILIFLPSQFFSSRVITGSTTVQHALVQGTVHVNVPLCKQSFSCGSYSA